MSNQKTYCEYFSATLLALVILIFGLFNTSGHIISTIRVIPSQVELILDQQNKFDEGSVSISKAYPSPLVITSKNLSPSFIFNSTYLKNYTILISVKHHSISKKLNSFIFNSISHFTQLTRIPQNSDDEFKS